MKNKKEQTNPLDEQIKTEEDEFAEFENEFNAENVEDQSVELVNPEDKKDRKKRKKYISTVAAFVLILGIGVVGNWYYQNTDVGSTIRPLIDSATEKTLGKAELVDATTDVKENDTYFTKARMERNSARDTALEKLQAVVSDTSENESARTVAAENITRISNFITIENKIETLVCAKGVDNCLAVIKEDGSGVDVIVDCKTLDDTTIMQIKDIAMSQLQCGFEDVSIIQSNNN
ncbi:SpoIIIAH-like family protein [uncultured Eubacterium sp.]|uniref:SpoIIIAH-like family protein n=1 Tax=uncultured Eubacterium sp. TaxID=165185 RepID=UPI00263235B6|nr:SpoIIIAH-like family protein [uncultured Eubacterium sp.]